MICKIQNKLLGHHGAYFMSKVNIQNTLMHFGLYGYLRNKKKIGFYKGFLNWVNQIRENHRDKMFTYRTIANSF